MLRRTLRLLLLEARLLPLEARLAQLRLARPSRPPADAAARLAALPAGLAVKERVTIHWNDHLVPFIEARSDEDLAAALGLVHAHLRLGQMEMLRRLSQGRIAECLGAAAVPWDHLLRLLDFGRAAARILESLPPATRRWLDGFVRGVNHVLLNAAPPHEFAALGLRREPWTVRDIVTLGRLAALDVTWANWFGLAPAGHAGSNAAALAARRSATGAALLGGTPHLPLLLPSPWLIVGMKSPTLHAVGLMPAGLPVIAMGRNPWIAWGGANLHAASSDLFDVSALAHPDRLPPFAERRETIRVRWGRARRIVIRETPLGPVVSDASLLAGKGSKPLALRWVGHDPSDEFTALLALARARDWPGFTAALAGFAASGQAMLYADAQGRIGRVLAASLPRRPADAADGAARPPEAAAWWRERLTAADLPMDFDPPEGLLVAANQPMACDAAPIGYFFSPPDRARRLERLLAAGAPLSRERLGAALSDRRWDLSLSLRDAFLRDLPPPHDAGGPLSDFLDVLRGWDGVYDTESRGALAFELLFHAFLITHYDEARRAAWGATWSLRNLVAEDVAGAPPGRLAASLGAALRRAARQYARCVRRGEDRWGARHRLRLMHPLGLLPLSGRGYRIADLPAAGGCETLYKTAHAQTAKRHAAWFGSGAMHLHDLSSLDRNGFLLLGGQDGWLDSACFADQVPLWSDHACIEVPLRLEKVREIFPFKTVLEPASG